MISRGQLKGRVLRFLNRTSAAKGFFDDAKMDDAVQMALNECAVYMFQAGDGWLTDLIQLDTVGGQVSVTLPSRVALIREIRYKVNETYYPMVYDGQEGQPSGLNTPANQLAWRYRLIGRQLVFDPQLAQGGPQYLQIECVYYPKQLVDDQDMIDQQFDAAMTDWICYKVATILSASLEKTVIAWADLEATAWQNMRTCVDRRRLSSVPIREGWD